MTTHGSPSQPADEWSGNRAPRPEPALVPRQRLIARLDDCRRAPLTLVSAPAGFGKTTLLTSWAAGMPGAVAWTTLDARHRDPHRLGAALISALLRIAPGLQLSVLEEAQGRLTGAEIGVALTDALARYENEIFLVIDDYHLAASGESDALVGALARHARPSLHALISTRSDPSLPLARMRLLDQVVEVRAADLRFTDEEARSLFARSGHVVDPALVAALLDQTGGWIAGLRLAILALPAMGASTRPAETIATDRHLMDFLIEEVLEAQAPETRSFLVRTAIVDRLCAPLAEAILGDVGREACREIFDRLARESPFLEQSEEGGEWFRLHTLFRNLLLHQLKMRFRSTEIADLHRRAAAWFSENGQLNAAVRHLVTAGDVNEAASLIESHVHDALNRENWNLVAGWLALLPEAVVHRRPTLLLAKGWVSRFSGRSTPVRSMLAQVDSLLATDLADDPNRTQLLAERDVLGALLSYSSHRDPEAELALSRDSLARVAPAQRLPFGLAVFTHGCALHAAGKTEEAIQFLYDAAHREEERIDAGTIRTLGGVMWVQRQAGNDRMCGETSSSVLALAQRHGLPVAAGWAHWMLGWLAYRRREIDLASHHFNAVLADIERVHLHCACEVAFGLALAHEAAGRSAEAGATVHRLLDEILDANALEYLQVVRAFKARLALLQGDTGTALDWLAADGVVTVGCNSLDAFDHGFVTRIRVLIAEGSPPSLEAAGRSIDEFAAFTKLVHHRGHEIDLLILSALVAAGTGSIDEAMPALRQAVELAAPGGVVQPFVEAGGAVGALLRQLAGDGGQSPFLARLRSLTAQTSVAPSIHRPSLAVTSGPRHLPELTERENEVLACLVRRLSYREIGDELFISLPTVKSHVHSVYDKLGVGSRREALAKAASLGVFPREAVGR